MKSSLRVVILTTLLGGLVLAPPAQAAIDKTENVKLVKTFKYTGGTDLDFSGKYVYAGQQGDSDGGVHVLDVSGKSPKHVSFIKCPGSQNDVAVVKPGLLALGYHAGVCGGGVPNGGVRLIDVSNPKRARFLGSVTLPGGTHTLTVYPGKPLIYASPGGLANGGGDEQIVDVSNPRKPKVAATFEPHAGGCHDLTFSFKNDRKLAFCAGVTQIQVWDVSDPLAPQTIGRIVNPAMFFPHSAVASPDGNLLVVGDEAFGVHECAAGGPTGSLYMYDISTPELPLLVGHFGPPRGAQPVAGVTPGWCTAHNYNFVPGTRVLVSAWYTGGTSVIDLANPTLPEEIAYFHPDDANTWSSYWYEGRIYANDGSRGLDVLEIKGLSAKKE